MVANAYKKKPRVKKVGNTAVVEVSSSRTKSMPTAKYRALRQSLKRPEHAGRQIGRAHV